MYMVNLDLDKCTGCGSCAEACPARLFEVKGEKVELVSDPSECMGCETCTTSCPTGAVTIQEL
ncbi:ferredoxin [Carboxydothermus islandicus]|uniref:Ferredoxin n=1 Tax=Carboxydothermus islandicus TaxID=661089 RepID=A0A1L8D4M3_9THEO|nr:4Fe-4S binding protein [Carboxydothermus islandicus]GAV26021.1 ferredoxin [Carboxydothermus islandicus]